MDAVNVNGVKYYPPQGEFVSFDNEEDYADKGRGWGLFGKAPKKQFWYKNGSVQRLVTIEGYQEYNNLCILVVAFEDGQLTCIHPSYLKEMQSSSFGKVLIVDENEGSDDTITPAAQDAKPISESSTKEPKAKSAPKKAKEKKEKLELPPDKVKFSAKVKEFATKPNPFSDRDDEVILLEEVVIQSESTLVIGDAWCGYSNTLKAVGLEEGDSIAFEGKVVDKKFNKEILYKVNNPSKIVKSAE